MILHGVNLLLLLIVIPIFGGTILCGRKVKVSTIYIYGWMLMLAVFEVLAVPATFLQLSFRGLTWIWMALIVLLAIIGAFKNYYIVRQIKVARRKIHPYKILFWLLCLMQIALVVILWHGDADDNYFLGIANTSLSTNTLFQFDAYTGQKAAAFPLRYVFSPFPVFLGSLSELTGIHPTILAHTILPIVFILLAYIIVRDIAECIWDNEDRAMLFCFVMAFLNFFGNYSIYTTSSFLLFRIWQGKAIVASVILPLLILWFLNEDRRGIREFCLLLVIVLAGCGVSSMGIVLQLLLLFAFGVVAVFRKKWLWVAQIAISSIPCFALSFAYIIACGR